MIDITQLEKNKHYILVDVDSVVRNTAKWCTYNSSFEVIYEKKFSVPVHDPGDGRIVLWDHFYTFKLQNDTGSFAESMNLQYSTLMHIYTKDELIESINDFY